MLLLRCRYKNVISNGHYFNTCNFILFLSNMDSVEHLVIRVFFRNPIDYLIIYRFVVGFRKVKAVKWFLRIWGKSSKW